MAFGYLSTDPMAGTPVNSTQPIGTDPNLYRAGMNGSVTPINTTQPVGSPQPFNPYEQGGFTGNLNPGPIAAAPGAPTGSLAGLGTNPAAQNQQNQDKLTQVVLQVANSGLTGQAGIDAINQQMGYNTGIVWDPTRGNFDVSTGGPNGIQYDTNAQGVYGAHPFNDAGMPGGGGGGGGIGFGSLINQLPTAAQATNMPGIQFGLDEALRGMQTSAAAKGTLLNGRTNQAMGQGLFNYALNQGYLPLAQLGLNYNQANVGNLQNLAGLGLNATSVGNQ